MNSKEVFNRLAKRLHETRFRDTGRVAMSAEVIPLEHDIDPQVAPIEDEKPTYDHPTIERASHEQIEAILIHLGIEIRKDSPNTIHYVSGVSANEPVVYGSSLQSFSQTHELGDPKTAKSVYLGTLTRADFLQLDGDARATALRDKLRPVSYEYNSAYAHGPGDDSLTFFWINDVLAGTIASEYGPIYYGFTAGTTADGAMNVSLGGTEIASLYTNNWVSWPLRWSADSYIRREFLQESEDFQMYVEAV